MPIKYDKLFALSVMIGIMSEIWLNMVLASGCKATSTSCFMSCI